MGDVHREAGPRPSDAGPAQALPSAVDLASWWEFNAASSTRKQRRASTEPCTSQGAYTDDISDLEVSDDAKDDLEEEHPAEEDGEGWLDEEHEDDGDIDDEVDRHMESITNMMLSFVFD